MRLAAQSLAAGLFAAALLMGQPGPGVSACSVAAYSHPHDASPTNLRAAPRADAKVIGQLPGLKGGPDTEVAEPEFEIIGSKDGWLLIRNARTADPALQPERVLLAGQGWIWGGLAGVHLADYALRSAPRADAPVVARLRNLQKGWGPDSFGVRTIHGCTGTWVEVTAAPPEGRELRGWVGHTCRSQLTTCDMGGIPQPPSFDCTKARSPAERMVCADPDSASLDQSLSEVFDTALDAVPRQAALRAEQQRWLADRRDKAADAKILRLVYQRRIGELQAAAEDAARVRALTASPDDLAGHCVPLGQEPDETCRVEEGGRMDGGLFYQLQGYFAGELRMDGGVVILAAGPDRRLRPVLWEAGDTAHFAKPRWIAAPDGRLLELRGSIEGTGNFSAGSLFRQVQGAWREIDAEAWQSDLAARLPKGRAVRKGIYPDWTRMTADTPLWRESDGECCPAGGSAHATLSLRGDRIVLIGVRVSEGQ